MDLATRDEGAHESFRHKQVVITWQVLIERPVKRYRLYPKREEAIRRLNAIRPV